MTTRNFWDPRAQYWQRSYGKPASRHAADSFNRRYVRRSTPKPWRHGII